MQQKIYYGWLVFCSSYFDLTVTCFFRSYISSAFLPVTVFLFYWFGKQEFGKFTNGIPVIGGPARPTPQSFHPSSCSWLVPFRWNYCDILHIPSLPLLSSLWVNLQLTCSQANPQIQFHSYHHGSPHMTLKVIFHKVKTNFLKNFYSSQNRILLLVFLWALVLI